MDNSDIMDVCRLCLDKDGVTIPIFEGEGAEREICSKIGSCLPVKVSSDDPLPKKICDDCTHKVELVYSFWNTTTNSEKQLLEWLGLCEPNHETPMDLLKTEMVILKGEHGADLSHMDLVEDSQDLLDQSGDTAEGSEEEGGREEDPGGGDYRYEEGTSNDPSSLDVPHPEPLPEAGPSRVLQQSQQPSQPPAQQIPASQSTPEQLTPEINPIRYCDSNENGGKREEVPSKAQKEVCDVCGKKYVASFMIVHKRTHTSEKPLDCPVCGTSFVNYKALRSHMVSHSDYRPFSCEICDRKFKRNNELNMHMKIHSGEKAYRCDLCDYSCVQKSNLVIHKKRHSNEYRFMCDICDKGCYTTQELQKHKMTHMDIAFKCKICNKEFHHKYGLTMHEKKHDPNYEPPVGQYKCELCGKSYVKYGGLKVHMRKHTESHMEVEEILEEPEDLNEVAQASLRDADVADADVIIASTHDTSIPIMIEDERELTSLLFLLNIYLTCNPFNIREGIEFKSFAFLSRPTAGSGPSGERLRCEICHIQVTTTEMEDHLQKLHSKARSFLCNICNIYFNNKSALIRHRNIHNSPSLKCELCGALFTYPYQLRRHARGHRTKFHLCQSCDKTFTSKDSLKQHVIREHKSYICDVCKKSFKIYSDYKVHLKLHLNIKIHTCDECSHAFARKSSLKSHLNRHHKTYKFICGVCGKGFYVASEFSAHNLIHTGDSPHNCSTCGKSYSRKSASILTEKANRIAAMLKAAAASGSLSRATRTFPCPDCDLILPSRQRLNQHWKVHHETPQLNPVSPRPKPQPIDEEELEGERAAAVAAAVKVEVHSGSEDEILNVPQAVFECAQCHKEFSSEKSLKVHQVVHSEERPYTCNVCFKSYKRPYEMKMHQRKHTEQKNLQCNDKPGNLTLHERVHTGERPYTCDTCGKSFSQRSTLVIHKRYHTGQRPYECPHCQKGFVCKALLNSHLKNSCYTAG
ncbi:hypothetical protein FOCC_FOCC005639 [Frankliniella occidentalis]|nr:hypothetical protein FOCC_FOCC005639 [Frankliniella occidentalis]